MSADNRLICHEHEGKWYVWMGSCSTAYFEPTDTAKVFDTEADAVAYAHEEQTKMAVCEGGIQRLTNTEIIEGLRVELNELRYPSQCSSNLPEDHNNNVILLGHYGSDLTHAQSAWTSTVRDIDESKFKRMPALLKTLAENKHHSVFEKSSIHFLVNTDIASHIHILKHRVGVSVNAESARYKELKEDKYFVPDDWPEEWQRKLREHTELSLKLYHNCIEDLAGYHKMDRKRVKESARFFRPYNTQITADVMFNFRSFAHFQGLRNKPDAQKEIRDISQQMLDLVKNIPGNPFQHTLAAFNL